MYTQNGIDSLKETLLRDPVFGLYRAAFFLFPFALGLFFTDLWCFAALLHVVLFLLQTRRNGGVFLPENLTGVCLGLLLFGAVWNIGFGVDSGAAGEGLLWLLSCMLFGLLLGQWTPDKRVVLLAQIPAMGACMTAVCLAAWFFEDGRYLLFQGGRMSGFFQYANTFALFLLIGLAILQAQPFSWHRCVWEVLLLAGIEASGSRGTMILLVLWAVWAFGRAQKRDVVFFGILFGAVLAGTVFAFLSGSYTLTGRFLRGETYSTFWGRLLYMKDALRLLAAHPLGVGRYGWSYLQGSVQTGAYEVRFVHNDLLQFALDYGCAALAGGLLWAARRLRTQPQAAAIALLILAHSLFDWDLQYPFMAFLLILALSPGQPAARHKAPKPRAAALPAAAVIPLFLWAGVSQALYANGYFYQAWRLAPWNTELAAAWMQLQPAPEQAAAIAQQILQYDPYCVQAWTAAADAAARAGDYTAMSHAMRQAVSCKKYAQDLYDDALKMQLEALPHGASAAAVRQEVDWLAVQAEKVNRETDALAAKLPESSKIVLPVELLSQINALLG